VCVSLNELARKGKLDPVIGRDRETQRAMQILGRRRKNNPVLIGDAGVGKTAIAEGIAQSIVNKTCPPQLLDKEIFLWDVTSLVSNTVFRGQLEGRLKAILDHVRNNPRLILFIDEIHLIVGAGNSIGGLDVSNMMKAALSRGEARVIGATTEDEYNKTIAKDSALERRFQPVRVEEPPDEDVLAILQGSLPVYEAHHNVQYTPQAVTAALQLSKRYIPHRQLPDKALDVLDEAGSAVRMTPPQNIIRLDQEIARLNEEKANAAIQQRFNDAQMWLARVRQLKAQRNKLLRQQTEPRLVTEDQVCGAVSVISRIPLERLTAEDKRSALRVQDELGREIIGRQPAIASVTRYIRRSRTRLNDPRKPLGAVLLLGPTGVGKTLLAKRAAVHVSGSEEGLIALDMSEYMERHSVARLIGAPPGYKGYEDQKTLVERVRRQPYAVVLFDEIEKAHQQVWNVLLQILEEGRLTDGQGRTASFRDTLVLLTSNIGYEHFRRKSIGFNQTVDATKDAVLEAAKKEFRPEFLNRLDDIVIFDPLTLEDCRQIIDLEVGKIRQRTKYTAVGLSQALREKILRDGFSEEYGARPLKRTLERLVTDPISDALLREEITDTGEILATYTESNGVVIRHSGSETQRAEQSTAVPAEDLAWVRPGSCAVPCKRHN
jgi:ATP-dependent Clp protease ATP-binding subunit ClpC